MHKWLITLLLGLSCTAFADDAEDVINKDIASYPEIKALFPGYETSDWKDQRSETKYFSWLLYNPELRRVIRVEKLHNPRWTEKASYTYPSERVLLQQAQSMIKKKYGNGWYLVAKRESVDQDFYFVKPVWHHMWHPKDKYIHVQFKAFGEILTSQVFSSDTMAQILRKDIALSSCYYVDLCKKMESLK